MYKVKERGNMKILIVNDDGIAADGIFHLAKNAAELGQIWVVAPAEQCSAMSHRITVHGPIDVNEEDYPLEGVRAFRVAGTPADCVKVGLKHLLPRKPDIVFSGINFGYNVGQDILYSGTVGAAMEALINEIPAIAFSKEMNDSYDVVSKNFIPIVKELLGRSIEKNEIWNVNFPGCPLSELKGVLDNRIPAQQQYYLDHYERKELENGGFRLLAGDIRNLNAEAGSDMRAVLDNYISIGKVRNTVLK